MVSYTPQLAAGYDALWCEMTIDDDRANQVRAVADRIRVGRPVYERISQKTGVPWYFIGLLHYRESDCDFRTHLHNGDTLLRRTVNVPAGRPPHGSPPFSFEESAIDALEYERFDGISDWSPAHIAYLAEQYNGFGYRAKGIRSPYLWGASNQQQRGKYVRDGVFDSGVWDTQLGVMPILKLLLDTEQPKSLTPTKNVEVAVSPQPSVWARLRAMFSKG